MLKKPTFSDRSSVLFQLIASIFVGCLLLPLDHLVGQSSQASSYRIQLDTLTIRAWGAERPILQTPSAVSVIQAVDLERDQEMHIAPVLNRVAGVFMQSSNLTTNRLTIRGIGSRTLYGTSKIKAYWNEIPLSTAEVSTQIEDLDLSTIGQIEVIKGPSSSLYGAGLGGTLLLTPVQAKKGRTQLSQQNSVGSFGLLRSVTQLSSASDKFSLNLNYSHNQWDGFRENNEMNRDNLNLFGTVQLTDKQKLSFIGTIIDLKAFIPSSINRDTYLNSPRAAAANWLNAQGFEDYNRKLIGLSYSNTFNDKWEFKGSVFGSLLENYEPRPFNILQEDQSSVGFRTTLNYDTKIAGKSLQTYVGSEVFLEQYDWQTYQINDRQQGNLLSDQNETRSYGNFFIQNRLQWNEALHIEAGLNVNRSRYNRTLLSTADTNLEDRYRFQTILSPRLAINYRLRSNISVFTSASHGFSPPTVQETLDPEGQINPDIQPEQGWNVEVGSRGSLISGRLFFDIVAYRMRVFDLLVARRTAEDQFIGLNAGSSIHRGIELSLQYLVTKQGSPFFIQPFITAGFNAHRFEDFIDGEQNFSNNELTGVPNQLINTGIDFSHKIGLYGNLNYQYVGSMPMRDDNSLYSESYDLLNLKLGFRKTLFSRLNVDVSSGIMNVLDEKYASQILINAMAFGNAQPRYYYPGLPRNSYLSMKVSYDF